MAYNLNTTNEKVIASAMCLFEIALKEKQIGNNIAIIKDGKIIKDIVGFMPNGD